MSQGIRLIRQVSMPVENEPRDTLRAALCSEIAPALNLVRATRERIAPLGGVDLPEMLREAIR
jgi:plasmid stability protein